MVSNRPDCDAISSQFGHSFFSPAVIDWVTAIIPCSHQEEILGGRVLSISKDGEIEWQQTKARSVVGSHESSLQVQTHAPGLLWISGNPAKWLQGHNIFGSDDLQGLMAATMRRLIPILGLVPSLLDYSVWNSGNYALQRVDATAMWDLPKRTDVRAWLRAVEMQAKSRHGRPISRGGTIYFGKHSRRWALKFYSKGDELEARVKGHKLPAEISHRDNLLKHADNKLRGELTLRGMQLKKLSLDRASAWNVETPQRVLLYHIKGLQMADQFSLTPALIEGLPPRLVLVYEAWMNGKDLRQIFPLRTFYRYRKELLAHGIDINIRQPARGENTIPLVRVLRPQAISQVTDWAIGTSLYFEPLQHRKAS